MSREVLHDAREPGSARSRPPSTSRILRDRLGARLGDYDFRDNVTRDRRGNRIGTGNLLLTLLR